jgi:hypothetical protein
MNGNSTGLQALRSLLASDGIRYGEPRSFSGLTLVPLFSSRRASFEYVLLSTAIRTGTASIEEVGLGHVPTLRIINRSAMPVLLIDGEHLVGVKQNRILNTTILVPEHATLDVPVSCVEQGRWGAPQGNARPVSPMLFAETRAWKTQAVTESVRRSGVYAANQGAIWHGVAQKIADLAVPSAPTSAMHAAYAHRASDIASYVTNLPWQSGQAGVVAAVGRRILCADLFDRAESLEGLWDRLIPSYAVEALSHPTDESLTVADATAFLRETTEAQVSEHPAVGRGTNLRITASNLVGAALQAEGTIVHLSLFRTEQSIHRPAWPAFSTVAQRLRHTRTHGAS